MPRIFDNIELPLLSALKDTLQISKRADFCVGYFNLRGWKSIDAQIEPWAGGDNACCRLMIGMQAVPQDELRQVFSLTGNQNIIDNQAVLRFKKRVAEEFREQLMIGAPSNADEVGLRRLSAQIKAKKVVIKLFLGHKLHAKLYLLYRTDPISPIVGYLGSSNLTFAGLSHQGELNVDVVEYDACLKLEKWFNDRWNDHWCLDISDELATIIDTSWAREEMLPPYYIYLKIAYHLSEEARSGLSEFRIPRDFGNRLFEYQSAAVRIAAHHVNKRDGVLIGDVVGLGKTLMATALARILQDDQALETLIICPKNLVKMWRDYVGQYRLIAEVLPISRVIRELPNLRRFRLIIIDESHNLRNRESLTYRAIKDYIDKNDSKCVLLSATPYNKTYLDLSNQLRLFVPEDRDLGIRPEKQIAAMGEGQFLSRFQCPVRSLAAFEKSEYADDWRDLMRLYMVRRTRSFIQDNYAETDPVTGRKYLEFADGGRSYFPTRVPHTVKFQVDERGTSDPYAQLYSDTVVETINTLNLPRYGLGNYIASSPKQRPTPAENQQLDGLSRAGKRLMGFCRTNLFKRLESSGSAFIQSLERHILRNYIYLHAIEQGLDLPIGTQDAEMLDTRFSDEDNETELSEEDDASSTLPQVPSGVYRSEADYLQRASVVYAQYRSQYSSRFKWLRPTLFVSSLKNALLEDARNLLDILTRSGRWDAARDQKLEALVDLLTKTHPNEKVLVFTQFADTVGYLARQLKARGIQAIEGVTGGSQDPTGLAWCFSPVSNEKRHIIAPASELRILVATDVLSEGQNLQDANIVVNYDLPWAIIRLIQRAGRVDRIGQKSDTILCYSFLPADGVERVIRLRARVRQRLQLNAEVVGTDEAFFEDDADDQTILNIYNEKAGILDGDVDTEVDLASYAYQIWKNATDANPPLRSIIEKLPNVVFSTRAHVGTVAAPQGVLVYMRTAEGNDSLAWIDRNGKSVTQSQLAILLAAECSLNTPAIERPVSQHELVRLGVEHIAEEEKMVGGQLGRPSGARYRTYQRLKQYADTFKDTLFESIELLKAIDDIYRYPLQQVAIDKLNRQLKSGISDDMLKDLVIGLRADDRLCLIQEEDQAREPHIICSLGLFDPGREY